MGNLFTAPLSWHPQKPLYFQAGQDGRHIQGLRLDTVFLHVHLYGTCPQPISDFYQKICKPDFPLHQSFEHKDEHHKPYLGSIQLLYLGLNLAKRLMLILASTFVCQCRLKLVFWILWNIKNKLRNILNNLCKVKLPLLVKIYKTLYLTISSSTATSWQIFPRDCQNWVWYYFNSTYSQCAIKGQLVQIVCISPMV